MLSLSRRLVRRTKRLLKVTGEGRLRSFRLYLPYVQKRRGFEIGGPSQIFRRGSILPVYPEAETVDNCDFSAGTVWAQHKEAFSYDPEKAPGKNFFCEGSALAAVDDSSYDFVLSSHNLEHFANPVKALKEWQRILKPGGALILVLPYYRHTFDHRRDPTPVDHMFDDFEKGMSEDDLTHLPEILEKHDLAMDPPAGPRESFRQRSMDNFSNRCLHHHVFDKRNSRELLSRAGFQVLALEIAFTSDLCILARMP